MKRAILTVLLITAVLTLLRVFPRHSEQAPVLNPRTNEQAKVRMPFLPPRFDWRQIESTNYVDYVRNLRRIGCPEQTVRDIVIADVNALYELKERDRIPGTNGFPYWKTGVSAKRLVRDSLIRRHEQLERERVGILKQLLGNDVSIEPRPLNITDENIVSSLLDFLPESQRPQVADAISTFDKRFNTEFKPLLDSGNWGDQNRQAYVNYLQQRNQQLLEALGPEGKKEYEMRSSWAADYLRQRFSGLNLSPDEFRQLYEFAAPFEINLDYWAVNYGDPAQQQATDAAKLSIWEEARSIVGDDRLGSVEGAPLLRQYGLH